MCMAYWTASAQPKGSYLGLSQIIVSIYDIDTGWFFITQFKVVTQPMELNLAL